MKLTRHNGRSGKHGTYNPKHNDRTFDVSNSEHIDEERAKHNVYWDCFNGYRTFAEKQVQSELADTFEEVEELFYSAKYGAYVEAQNARNDKNRHSERNRTTTDLLKDKRTCPEETIYQIGKMGRPCSAGCSAESRDGFLCGDGTAFRLSCSHSGLGITSG